MKVNSAVAATIAALILPCFLPAAYAEDTADNAFQVSRRRFDQKAHIKIDYAIHLSSGMETALKKFNPDFRIWESDDYLPSLIQLYEFKSFPRKDFFAYQTPSAVIGDFNGDNTPDAVMMGYDKTSSLTVAIISGAGGYRVIEIGQGPRKNPKEEWYGMYGGEEGREYGFSSYVTLFPPGKIPPNASFNRPEINLKTDAVIMAMFEKSSIVLIYKEGKFISYTMGD